MATFVDDPRAKQPPLLEIQGKKNPTTEDIYLEAAQLRQAVQQTASQVAERQVSGTLDVVDGLMVIGVAIDPERYEPPSVLHRRVIQRERWTRVALAILAFFGGGR